MGKIKLDNDMIVYKNILDGFKNYSIASTDYWESTIFCRYYSEILKKTIETTSLFDRTILDWLLHIKMNALINVDKKSDPLAGYAWKIKTDDIVKDAQYLFPVPSIQDRKDKTPEALKDERSKYFELSNSNEDDSIEKSLIEQIFTNIDTAIGQGINYVGVLREFFPINEETRYSSIVPFGPIVNFNKDLIKNQGDLNSNICYLKKITLNINSQQCYNKQKDFETAVNGIIYSIML